MGRKRANGEGNNSKVAINGKKYYRVRITVGFDAITGKQKRKDFYGITLKEAKGKAEDYKNRIVNTSDFDTVGAYYYNWLWNIKRSTVALSTFQRLEGIYRNYIKTSPLNNLKLSDVDVKHLQPIYNHMNKSLNADKIKRVNTALSTCFNYALKTGDIKVNPCSLVDLPQIRKVPKTNYINIEKQKLLIKAIEGDSMELCILIGLMTGARLGEILALTVDDINFNNKTISINKSLKYVWTGEYDKKGKRLYEYIIKATKTETSNRDVPFNSILEDRFKTRIDEINTFKKDGIYNGELLIADNIGNPIDLKKPARHLHNALKRAGIEYDLVFHSLRHIFISNCIYADIPLKVIVDYVGHSDYKMVMQVYAEIDKERNFKEYNKLDNLYK